MHLSADSVWLSCTRLIFIDIPTINGVLLYTITLNGLIKGKCVIVINVFKF